MEVTRQPPIDGHKTRMTIDCILRLSCGPWSRASHTHDNKTTNLSDAVGRLAWVRRSGHRIEGKTLEARILQSTHGPSSQLNAKLTSIGRAVSSQVPSHPSCWVTLGRDTANGS